jgi:hypothetical protein
MMHMAYADQLIGIWRDRREEGPPPQRRIRLPKPAQQEKSVSLWSILKVCRTKVAAPKPCSPTAAPEHGR